MLGIHPNKDTFCSSSVQTPCLHIRLHPIPVLCLRKQFNQTQRPVGCETNVGTTLRPEQPSIMSFGLEWKTKQTETHKNHTQLSELS